MKWDESTVESMRAAARRAERKAADRPDTERAYLESVRVVKGSVIGVAVAVPLYLLALWALWAYVSS